MALDVEEIQGGYRVLIGFAFAQKHYILSNQAGSLPPASEH